MGLLDRRPGYYRVKITLTIFAFFAGWALFVIAGNSWAALAVAALTVLIGLSFGWWVPKHNVHHAHPNEIGRDPDIGEGSALSADVPGEGRGPVASWLARWQAPLFFPLMLLRSSGMHVLGIQRFVQRRDRASALEASLIVLHAML